MDQRNIIGTEKFNFVSLILSSNQPKEKLDLTMLYLIQIKSHTRAQTKSMYKFLRFNILSEENQMGKKFYSWIPHLESIARASSFSPFPNVHRKRLFLLFPLLLTLALLLCHLPHSTSITRMDRLFMPCSPHQCLPSPEQLGIKNVDVVENHQQRQPIRAFHRRRG